MYIYNNIFKVTLISFLIIIGSTEMTFAAEQDTGSKWAKVANSFLGNIGPALGIVKNLLWGSSDREKLTIKKTDLEEAINKAETETKNLFKKSLAPAVAITTQLSMIEKFGARSYHITSRIAKIDTALEAEPIRWDEVNEEVGYLIRLFDGLPNDAKIKTDIYTHSTEQTLLNIVSLKLAVLPELKKKSDQKKLIATNRTLNAVRAANSGIGGMLASEISENDINSASRIANAKLVTSQLKATAEAIKQVQVAR